MSIENSTFHTLENDLILMWLLINYLCNKSFKVATVTFLAKKGGVGQLLLLTT